MLGRRLSGRRSVADLREHARSRFEAKRFRGQLLIETKGSQTTDKQGKVTTTWNTLYDGPFYARYPGLAWEQTPEVTGQTMAVSRIVIRIPFPERSAAFWKASPPKVPVGARLTVVSDPGNAQFAGTVLRVASIDDQSDATAQRLFCEDFQSGTI